MEKFKVIVAGSRKFKDYAFLSKTLDYLLRDKVGAYEIVIISGCAAGADTLGERWASERGWKVNKYPADWNGLGKAAGFIRNEQMAEAGDALVAFSINRSRGTAHMIDCAKRKQLPTRIYEFTD